EDHVELAALGGLGAAHIMLDMQRAVGRHIGMAPGGRVIAVAADRQPEPHLACRHHFVSWPERRMSALTWPQSGDSTRLASGMASRPMAKPATPAPAASTSQATIPPAKGTARATAAPASWSAWLGQPRPYASRP